ncbi:MAG: major capsid protein [Minwuia sp.]|nr:major capsid protein [Minwuia sp.]
MASMDIFAADGFSAMSMTAALNNQPFLPSLLGDMRLFTPKPITTDTAAIEQINGTLGLIQTDKRGAPPAARGTDKRTLRHLSTVRISQQDTVRASEIQGIRAFGSESELMQVQTLVARKQTNLLRDVALTHEHHRLGAVQGIVLDADGSQIVNLFTEFGVTQPDEIDFDLDNASPDPGAVRVNCAAVNRAMQRASKGSWIEGVTSAVGRCGDAFWDDLITHPEVERTYEAQQAGAELRRDITWQWLDYGGIRFVNYRGTDDTTTVTIGSEKCKFFPVNALDVFEVALSPAESFDFVNTPGLPVYGWQVPDRDRNMFVDLEVYSYPLFYCTKPAMLQRAKRT